MSVEFNGGCGEAPARCVSRWLLREACIWSGSCGFTMSQGCKWYVYFATVLDFDLVWKDFYPFVSYGGINQGSLTGPTYVT